MTTGWPWRRPRRPSPALEAFLDWLGATPYTWRVEADGKLRARDGDDIMCAVTAVARHRTGQRYSVGDWPRAGDRLGLSYAESCLIVTAADDVPAGVAASRFRQRLIAAADTAARRMRARARTRTVTHRHVTDRRRTHHAPMGLALTSTAAMMHGSSPRTLQEWFVPRWTRTSPARRSVSPVSRIA